MRPSLVTPAIVLRARPFGESDKIVSFLTEHYGRLSGIAKGALRSRRRFVNSLEPFSFVNLSFYDRPHSNLAFLVTAELIHGHRDLINNLDRIAHASYLAEITEGLVGEREENRAAFQHLLSGLRYLERNGASPRFLTGFELKLLQLVGYRPRLDHCKRCQKHWQDGSSQWYFSSTEGGIVCVTCARSCRDVLPLGRTAMGILVALQSEDSSLPHSVWLPRTVITEMRSTILRFIQFHMGRKIKSAPFLQSLTSP